MPPGGVASFAPESALAIALQTASMCWMTRWPVRHFVAGLFAKAGYITLPDYGAMNGDPSRSRRAA